MIKRLLAFLYNLYNPTVYGKAPLLHVTGVKHLGGHRLALAFSDGAQGVIDLAQHVPFTGILAPLADPAFVAKAYIDRGTLCWPGDLDMDTKVLHHLALGLPIELVSYTGVRA